MAGRGTEQGATVESAWGIWGSGRCLKIMTKASNRTWAMTDPDYLERKILICFQKGREGDYEISSLHICVAFTVHIGLDVVGVIKSAEDIN